MGSVLDEEERSKPGNTGAAPLMDKMLETLETLAASPELETRSAANRSRG